MLGSLRDALRLVHHSARTVGGRWFWLAPLLPLFWVAFQYITVVLGWRDTSWEVVDAQNTLIGFPLAVLASGLGVRVIAGEIDRRTLEIAYTVPGGAHRVWLSKLSAVFVILLCAEGLLALATYVFCTSFPLSALYGALQSAVFFMVLSMGLGAMLRSEAAGAMVCAGVLTIALMATPLRISPFFNIELPQLVDLEAVDRIARLVQNRVGYVLVTAAVMLLTFGRAEQRERLLSG
jgi:ABC-type transport system involved in multi-copper enzyme maturation permease subunit